jgi:hypothetical protein
VLPPVSASENRRFRRGASGTFPATAGCLATAVAAAGPAAQTLYRVTILSSAAASGNSINNLGLTSGSYTLATGALHASLWAYGQQIDLGTLGHGAIG